MSNSVTSRVQFLINKKHESMNKWKGTVTMPCYIDSVCDNSVDINYFVALIQVKYLQGFVCFKYVKRSYASEVFFSSEKCQVFYCSEIADYTHYRFIKTDVTCEA